MHEELDKANSKWCINGRFLTRRITGVDRFAREIVRELDNLVSRNEVVLLLPKGSKPINMPPLKNIEVRYYGNHQGHIWEQLDLPRFARGAGMIVVNLCNTAPLFEPGIVCIHDMSIRANPSFYSYKFRVAYRLLYRFVSNRACRVLTVSRFSESEIAKYYPKLRDKITVIPNAWQHIMRVGEDDSVLERNGLERGRYVFSMSSLAPNKNLKWLVDSAELNPNLQFVIAGGVNSAVFGKHIIPQSNNVRYLGYVTDCEAKSLMRNCSAFIYPTFYEGFGIPPMEAIASGSPKVMVSDNPCMHEVYGDCVSYVNPYVPCKNLENVLDSRARADSILESYSWNESAKQLISVLRGIEQ